MKNRVIDNMISIWDGHATSLNFVKQANTYLYLVEGPRAIIVTFDFNENWNGTPDVRISDDHMVAILQMEDLFEIPTIIAVNYNDRQCWIKAMDVYTMMCKHTGVAALDLTHEKGVFIPKERFNLLIKESKNVA